MKVKIGLEARGCFNACYFVQRTTAPHSMKVVGEENPAATRFANFADSSSLKLSWITSIHATQALFAIKQESHNAIFQLLQNLSLQISCEPQDCLTEKENRTELVQGKETISSFPPKF